MDHSTNNVIGSFETIRFPEFNDYEVTAKIDTGAYSGALHCTELRIEHTEYGPVLRFSPFDRPDIEIESNNFSVKEVRSSNGTTQNRYFIKTKVHIQGNTYPITISLADRSDMKWPVLIGRRFLRRHKFLVDVTQANK